jgi:hypothetical protein
MPIVFVTMASLLGCHSANEDKDQAIKEANEKAKAFDKEIKPLFEAYLSGDSQQAKQALEEMVRAVEGSKVSPKIQAYGLWLIYARLYILERRLGNAELAEANILKSRYWLMRRNEIDGATPEEAAQRALQWFTADKCMEIFDKWDKALSEGKGPKYLQEVGITEKTNNDPDTSAYAPPAVKAAPDPTEVPPATVSKLTELVATFYKVLLQKEEPTLQQEKDLFGLDNPLRINLLARKKGVATDPLILNLFRQNRDLFLPLGKLTEEEYRGGIQLTSPFDFVTSLNQIKGKAPEGRGLVMALFVHEVQPDRSKNVPPRLRTIVFSIEGGKIQADAIWLDGFQGPTTFEKFFEMIPDKP